MSHDMKPNADHSKSPNLELTPEMLQKLFQHSGQNDMADDEIDLVELWQGLMRRKGLILILTGLVTLTTLIISMLMTPQYQTSTKLMPVSSIDGGSDLMSKYGGLASLAGISLPSGGEIALSAEAVETLKSRRFLSTFILENDLKKVLFYKQWNSEDQNWIYEESSLDKLEGFVKSSFFGEQNQSVVDYPGKEVLSEGEPSIYEVVEFFDKDILSISEDSKSGLFELSVKWVDPVLARDWANILVSRVDNELRQKAIEEAQATIDYMDKKLPTIELQDLRTIALQMIEENIKKITFAEVKNEYVFKVIDPAIVPEQPISPIKGLMVAVGLVLGLMLSIFISLILNWREAKKLAG